MRKLLAALFALAFMASASPAHASTYEPCKWNASRVGVHVRSGVATSWQVRGAIATWNDEHTNAPHLYLTSNIGAPVVVSIGGLGSLNGQTVYTCGVGWGTHMHVTLNPYRRLAPWERANVTRHEFGHVLGLGHRYSGSTIMRPLLVHDTFYPTTSDVLNLNRLYR